MCGVFSLTNLFTRYFFRATLYVTLMTDPKGRGPGNENKMADKFVVHVAKIH